MPIPAWARFALVTLLAGTQGPPRDLMIERSASLFSRLLPGEIENAAGSKDRHVAKDRILPAEGGGMRGTRAGSRRQGRARAFSQVSGFMAQRGEPIRILVRPCSRPDAAVAAVAAHALAQHARLALAPERRAHGYDGGAARGGMIQHVGSAPLGLGLNVQTAPLNNFAATESVKRVSARGSRHRIAPSSAATLGQAPMAERPVVLPPERGGARYADSSLPRGNVVPARD